MSTAIVMAADVQAQDTAQANDSIATALRLNNLQTQKNKLLKDIKAEDAKRNRQILGVNPETLEEINEQQDSVCLALRSELVSVILEIKELSPEVAISALLQQYNSLVKKPNTTATEPNSTPAQTPSQRHAPKPKK